MGDPESRPRAFITREYMIETRKWMNRFRACCDVTIYC